MDGGASTHSDTWPCDADYWLTTWLRRPGFIALILVVVKKGSYNIGKNIHNLKKKPGSKVIPKILFNIYWMGLDSIIVINTTI